MLCMGRGVKGKQVRILYDPVTVFGECKSDMSLGDAGKTALHADP